MTEERVVALLREKGWHISAAESCTGGLVQARLVNVPGSSDVFDEGYVTYANRSKQRLLGVSEEILKTRGAVSAECARAMADGCRQAAGSDIALAVTGIAGPGGGTPEKPVGLVYTACAAPEGTRVEEHHFTGDRAQVRAQAAEAALAMALGALEDEHDGN